MGINPRCPARLHVDHYARGLEEAGESASTRARRLAAISSLYKYAISVGVLVVNPCQHARRPKVDADASPPVGLTEAEAVAMLKWAEKESPRTHCLVALLLLGGLRVSEALSVRAEDLSTDRGHRFLTVHRKGGKVRRVVIAPGLAHALDILLGGRTEGLILTTRTGAPWDRAEAWHAVKRIAGRAEVTKAARISPHSLRHTAVTLALANGASLERVQDFVGHADPRTTRRYDRRRGALDGHAAYQLDA
jgi:site-specific recombinase XerD